MGREKYVDSICFRSRRCYCHRSECGGLRFIIHGNRFAPFFRCALHTAPRRHEFVFHLCDRASLGDNEAVKIAAALEKNSTMKCINLANNHIKVGLGSIVHGKRCSNMSPDKWCQCVCESSSRPRSFLNCFLFAFSHVTCRREIMYYPQAEFEQQRNRISRRQLHRRCPGERRNARGVESVWCVAILPLEALSNRGASAHSALLQEMLWETLACL